jgi:UDP-N-acetylmuramate: L-alanyl-gamma-D-glutamyl-meso-diaminopimelate ligase
MPSVTSPTPPLEYYRAKAARLPNAAARLAARKPMPKSPRRIHVIGVCGTAMGSLAALLKDAGYEVTGSDTGCYAPISDLLEGKKIEVLDPDLVNLVRADMIVVGNSSGPDNLETEGARSMGKPYGSLAEVLPFAVGARKLLACCGTHGKTTSTAMLATVLEAAGENPGYLVGGVRRDTDDSSRLGAGRYFVVEGDEYDTAYFDKRPKFLSYGPYAALVTSVELDHMDIYEGLDDYRQAFRYLAEGMPKDGVLVLNADSEEVAALAGYASSRVATYGFGAMAECRGENLRADGEAQTFDVEWRGGKLGEIRLPMSGRHNAENALGVCALALSVGIPFGAAQKGLAKFAGVKRRQEPIFEGEFEGRKVTVLDDFAHHPTAVRETISAVRAQYPDRWLVAAFEPRSNTSRRKVFEVPYGEALSAADALVLKMPQLRHVDRPDDFVDGASITAAARTTGKRAQLTETAVDTVDSIFRKIRAADEGKPVVVLMMSNGSWHGTREMLVERLGGKK